MIRITFVCTTQFELKKHTHTHIKDNMHVQTYRRMISYVVSGSLRPYK